MKPQTTNEVSSLIKDDLRAEHQRGIDELIKEVEDDLSVLNVYWRLDWYANEECHNTENFKNKEDILDRTTKLKTEYGKGLGYDINQIGNVDKEERLSTRKQALLEAKKIHDDEIQKTIIEMLNAVEKHSEVIDANHFSVSSNDSPIRFMKESDWQKIKLGEKTASQSSPEERRG